MFSRLTNLITSTLDTLHSSDAEIYQLSHIFNKSFRDIIMKYINKFSSKNLRKNHIESCKIISDEIKNNIVYTTRIMVIDLFRFNIILPHQLLQYLPERTITIEHITSLDMNNKILKITSKNITYPQACLNEISLFTETGNKTYYEITASLSVDICTGINEIIKKIWVAQYKSHFHTEFITHLE